MSQELQNTELSMFVIMFYLSSYANCFTLLLFIEGKIESIKVFQNYSKKNLKKEMYGYLVEFCQKLKEYNLLLFESPFSSISWQVHFFKSITSTVFFLHFSPFSSIFNYL